MALALILSCVPLSPLSAEAAAADYIAQSYASSLLVITKTTTNLMEGPSASANAKYTLPADTVLTVQALHRNTSGEYWYEVLYYNMTLYVKAANTTMAAHLTGDVTVTDVCSPASLAYGASFAIAGKISSELNDLGTITAAMRPNTNISRGNALESSDNAGGKSYNLASSVVDANLKFGNLAAGIYTYVLTAEAVSYYIDSNGQFATSKQTVVLNTQQCVVTDWRNPNDDLAFGIDVSVWQGAIDWSKAKNDIDFAILRIGYATSLDSRFVEYATACEKYGIPYGVYLYSYALTGSGTAAEAQFVIDTLKQYGFTPELPIWYDLEDSTQQALPSATKEALVTNFCDTIAAAGYQPGFYGFTRWFSSSFQKGYLSSIPVWIAQIDGFSSNGTATHDGGTWLWQYSWEGSISGISGDVDCNICYFEYPGINSDSSYLSKCTYYPSNMDVTVSTAVNMRQYPSTDYTIIQNLAVGTKLHVTGLYKNASGGLWYQVEKEDGTGGYVSADYVTINSYRYDDLAAISPTMASNINLGAGYYLDGKLTSQYNELGTIEAKIYNGEDLLGTPALTSSDAADGKTYNLKSSAVCSNLIFSKLTAGYYTYELSADVVTYYANNGSIASKTNNVVVWTAPFTVGSAPIEPPASVACDHNVVTDPAVAPGCLTTGLTEGSHCTKCGVTFTEQASIPAVGHKYNVTIAQGTCLQYSMYTFTCTGCGLGYTQSEDTLTKQWIETIPSGMDASLFNTKTQYRYSDCTSAAVDTANGIQGSVTYVKSWPSGFNTSSSFYTQYNKASSKVTATETATTKVVINSDKQVGYLWYHWCDTSVTSSWAYEKDPYHTFHVYYNTDNPNDYSCDTSDYSYKTAHSSCSNSAWWLPIEVYTQTYTTYNKISDGLEWSDWSDWSDTPVTAIENTRKVETRTMYQLKEAHLGDHQFVAGTCRLCGEADPNVQLDYYLFGYIDNRNYGCEDDFTTLGEYKFDENGKLTTTFMHDSYVAVKASDNYHFYMTNGWQGYECTSAILYSTGALSNADKLYVPGGAKITFTLVDNGDDTFNLSYEIEERILPPVLTAKYPTLSIEDEILVNVYFEIENLNNTSLSDIGILTWDIAPSNGTVANAETARWGAIYDSDSGLYYVETKGIAAKKLSDTFYFRLVAKDTNGNYVYGDLLNYSPKTFAINRLNSSSTSTSLKQLLVAMLNYGAAAQTYFNYKPYNLMNSSLTSSQKALVSNYSSNMIQAVGSVPSSRQGSFANNGGFSKRQPSVSLEGAFAINYYFTPAYPVKGEIKMYYWTQEVYNKVNLLSSMNASGMIIMEPQADGSYIATIDGIAAKNIDSALYVAATYISTDGTYYATGVLPYSLGSYCGNQAAYNPLASAIAVYGYYAKLHFSN